VEVHAAAPGIYYVFKDPVDAQAFLANRVYTYRPRLHIDPHELYESIEQDLQPLLSFMTAHGRAPRADELSAAESTAIKEAIGSVGRGVQLIRKVTDDEYWEKVSIQRRAELLVYIALSRFGGR